MMKGAIFDMDGVVVDNYEYHFKAWLAFASKYNFELDATIYREKFNGRTNRDLFSMIFGQVESDQIKKWTDEKEGMYRTIYFEHMKAHVGLVDFLDYLQSQKILVALGTSAPTSNVDFTLDRLNLRRYFDVIVDGTHVQRGKPDPQVYQLCAMKMGLSPEECVVFEDSLSGLESGERAGCKIVGVSTSHKFSELKEKTDLIIHDFTEARNLLGI